MCVRESSFLLSVFYVWQGKELQMAKNGILGCFSDVWQGMDLAVFGWYSR